MINPISRFTNSVFICSILLLSGCSVSTQPVALKWGELDLYRVTASTGTGDSSYVLAVAQFYQNGDPSQPATAGTVKLNGKDVPYDYVHNYYTTDSMATQQGYDEWSVTGAGSIPAFSIRLNTPPSLAISSLHLGDTVLIDSITTVRWTPSVSGSNIGIEVDNDSSHSSIYSSLPINDIGSASLDPSNFSPLRKGKVDIYIFRDNAISQQTDNKTFIANSESAGRVTVILH